jgi:hypothetical protein
MVFFLDQSKTFGKSHKTSGLQIFIVIFAPPPKKKEWI